jgi:hypothetical protein
VNRSEQIANRAQPDGQATNLSNLQINERRLDADYEIRKHNLARSEMGLLKVFDLVPRTAGKANFEARLDDGNPGKRREPELDFDITGVSDDIKTDFKRKEPRLGYSGHHSDRSPNPNQRIYDVEIKGPWGTVFEGEVSLNATFSVGVSESITATATVDAVVIRANRRTKD